ncbi:MAG: hypothetical protein E6Q83_04560 [Thiothrix sp.]|nr:MAG: hypothetical protein E6Q83_04560 [Thiothrix sp.]
MLLATQEDALNLLKKSWPLIIDECRSVLGSELHYQAMVYHCLRQTGVPREQLGMNVKMLITKPVSLLFQELDIKKHIEYQGAFEPIPDICIFSPAVEGDWRRRKQEQTLKSLLLAIEIKASERHKGRLSCREIAFDIKKLAAQRVEAQYRGSDFLPVVLIIDTAPDLKERMTEKSLKQVQDKAKQENVGFLYVSPVSEIHRL